jgi:hypothetical protein
MLSAASQSAVSSFSPEERAIPGVTKRRPFRMRGRMRTFWILIFIAGIGVGVAFDRLVTVFSPKVVDRTLPETAVFLKPGPWGRLAKIPLTISAPEEILPIRSLEAAGTRWFFGGVSREGLAGLLDAAGVSVMQREALESTAREVPGGLEVSPADDVLLALGPEARLEIYRMLLAHEQNRAQVTTLAAASLDERLRANGVSAATEELLRTLSCKRGNSVIFSGLACVLAKTPDYDEKVRLMKALTMQKTFLLRFHMQGDSDFAALAAYWGRGAWSTDTKAMLESLSRVPGGIWSSTMLLLPPLPVAQLYSYPVTQEEALGASPRVARDCHWTSFNFFRSQPDPNYTGVSYFNEKLRENYTSVMGDPRYGDLVFFARPDGSVIHSAVFIADDVVYTKNGGTYVHPWMLSTIPDLEEYYSAQLAPGENLTVSYYRKKYE